MFGILFLSPCKDQPSLPFACFMALVKLQVKPVLWPLYYLSEDTTKPVNRIKSQQMNANQEGGSDLQEFAWRI